MKKKVIPILVAAVLVLLMTGWRIWPHSMQNILSLDGKTVQTISVGVTEMGVADGSPTMDQYQLSIASPEDENYGPVMAILEGADFRSDFRNWLPWDITSVGSDSELSTVSVVITVAWGDEIDEKTVLFLSGDRTASVDSSGKSGLKIYHPVDRTLSEQIAAYVKEHGTVQK